jgi:hypothetical protein
MNLRNLSNKQKLKMLAVASPLALLICYNWGISKTIDQYHAYTQSRASDVEYKASAASSQKLRAKQKELDAFFTAYKLDTLDAGRNLLTIVTDFCNDHELQLREYKPVKTSTQGGMQVLTRSVTVEGSFMECVLLVHALEKKYSAGRVCSVSYASYTDRESKLPRLTCTFFIQNIIG